MKFDPKGSYADHNIEESFNLRPILEKYLNHITWFLVSIVAFLILAFFYLNYSSSKYEAAATVLIKDNEKGNSVSGLAAFESLGLFADAENSLENEIQILKSRKLMTQVVKELNLHYRYFIDNSPLDIELYPETPVLISFDSNELDVDHINTKFKLTIISKDSFKFIDYDGNESSVLKFGQNFVANLGNDAVKLEDRIKINLNDNILDRIVGKTIIVRINSLELIVDDLMTKTMVEPINANISKVIVISLKQTVREKAISVINNLIEQYNADGNNDKNQISQTTTQFLDERITLISAELYAIEGMAEKFKSKNRMVTNQEGAEYFLQSSSLNERELVASNTELQLVNYMLEELNKRAVDQLLPGNIGLSDVGIVTLITQYNELILQRNRVLKSSSLKNPIIVGIDGQLNVLKDNLVSSLNNLKSSTEIQLAALNTQSGKISSQIASVPKNEREFKDIVREEETKNALYLFMLQKREESILSNAVDVNKAKIIDMAYAGKTPVSPKKGIVYLFAIFLGVLMPVIYIYLMDALDLKVRNEFDLNKLDIPYLGDIPMSSTKNNLFLNSSDSSNVAEAFRYIRTNIGFMLDRKESGKTVFVTSTQGGEGKSFTSLNLATSLALSGKRTLLMTLDLRAPKLTKYLDLEDGLGVTNFVVNKELKIDNIIEKDTRINDLHFINSGDIPPNPVELLMSKRVSEIFNYVKEQYEYIVVDTAPVGMVTDTIQINQFADLTLYVVKANFLDKRMLYIPKRMNEEGKLKNMAILLNGTNHSKGRYGYGYGYGYGSNSDKPWYRKVFDF